MRPGTKRTTEIDGVIGARIRMRRGELGMSQTELAKAVGVTFQQVQKYERGANRVGGSRLARVAEALDVPVAYFFDQSSEEMEAVQGSLLSTRGAVSLLRAYAAIKNQRQRQVMVNMARAMAGEEPLGDADAAH
jgi:transcriptional regulator with XRE-family HTH domain